MNNNQNNPQDNEGRPYPDHVSGTFMDKSKLPQHILDKMKKNQENSRNPQEVPQVKSVEERATEIIRRIPVHPANFDYISKRQYGINGSLAQDIKYAMKEYAQPLADRISELEALNDKYREALEEIMSLDSRSDDRPDLYDATQIAYNAINSLEVGNV